LGATLGLASGLLLTATWLIVGEQSGKPATLSAGFEILRAGLLAGIVGGTAWSAKLSENAWLATLLALVALAVAGAALFQTGAIL
jgi:hypothetical protein